MLKELRRANQCENIWFSEKDGKVFVVRSVRLRRIQFFKRLNVNSKKNLCAEARILINVSGTCQTQAFEMLKFMQGTICRSS